MTEYISLINVGKYEGASFGACTGGLDPTDHLTQNYHSNSILQSGRNNSNIRDSPPDKMIEEQDRILDPKKRIQLLKEIQLYLADKIYYAPDTVGNSYELVSPKVRDYKPHSQWIRADSFRYVWIDE